MTSNFTAFGLPPPMVQALTKSGVTVPFPVQAATIPDVLAGRDVSGKAPTGSGKTLAFGLPLLARVGRGDRNRPRALILAPTRELADQIRRALAPLGKTVGREVMAVYGGVGYGPQKNGLRKGVDVLVATPGRLEDLMAQGSVDLSQVDIVVVDEADRMADMGFFPAVRRILDKTSRDRQTLLFSATLDGDVAVLSRVYQRHPVRHEAAAIRTEQGQARHHFWLIDNADRVDHTVRLVKQAQRSIVFTRTRHRADRLAKQMNGLGVEVVAIHGGRSQSQRTRALEKFSSGRALALVATDVAARGIHVDDVASVIHFDLPADSKDYLHRSGRTARAGAGGAVFSLVTGDQRRDAARIQRDLDINEPIAPPAPMTGGARSRPQAVPTLNTSAESMRVFVNNLPWRATSDDLEAMFAGYGEVRKAQVVTDGRGRSKGYGFVDMSDHLARRAIQGLHGSRMDGRQIKVRPAQADRTP